MQDQVSEETRRFREEVRSAWNAEAERQQKLRNRRKALFWLVERGRMTPEEAEDCAARKNLGALASKPDPAQFNPDAETYWTLPMVAAWLRTYSSEAVRLCWHEYRCEAFEWVIDVHTLPDRYSSDPKALVERVIARVKQMSPVSIADVLGDRPPFLLDQSIASSDEIRTKLMAALQSGGLPAFGVPKNGTVPQDIQSLDWTVLSPFEPVNRRKIRIWHDAVFICSDFEPTFVNVRVERVKVMELWPRSTLVADETAKALSTANGETTSSKEVAALGPRVASEAEVKKIITDAPRHLRLTVLDLIEYVRAELGDRMTSDRTVRKHRALYTGLRRRGDSDKTIAAVDRKSVKSET